MSDFASKDLTAGQLNALVKIVGGYEQVLEILSGKRKLQFTTTPEVVASVDRRILTVPADLPFEERIRRGNYAYRDSNLTEEKFPITLDQFGKWEARLFHFDRNISSKEVITLMRQGGFDPGFIGHTLAFGESFPNEQRDYPIVGLGSVAGFVGSRCVPVLWSDSDGRELCLRWYDCVWNRDCRFLGVRRLSGA